MNMLTFSGYLNIMTPFFDVSIVIKKVFSTIKKTQETNQKDEAQYSFKDWPLTFSEEL